MTAAVVEVEGAHVDSYVLRRLQMFYVDYLHTYEKRTKKMKRVRRRVASVTLI